MYGLDVTRHNMARCPFHDDRHPRLKLNPDFYYCFGCGARGDVIDLVKRLVANDYRFTISERSKDNIDAIVKDANNILEFLASEGYLTFHEDSKAATSDLYVAYKEWCEDNAENALSMKSFANYLSQYSGTYHLIPDNNIYRGKGKRCRGYRGVEIIDDDNPFL